MKTPKVINWKFMIQPSSEARCPKDYNINIIIPIGMKTSFIFRVNDESPNISKQIDSQTTVKHVKQKHM